VKTEANGTAKGKRRRRLPVTLTETEEAALVAQVNTGSATGLRNRALLAVLLGAGLRVAEAVALRPGDVDYTAGQVRVNAGKGDKDRIVPVDGETLAHLRAWAEKRAGLGLNGHRPLFCRLRRQGFGEGGVGSGMSADNVQALVTRLAKAAGMEKHVTPHVLRHTYACKLLRRPGATLTDVQLALGHVRLSTTAIYLHAEPEHLRRVVQGEAAPADPQVAALAEALAGLSGAQRAALVAALAGK